MAFAYLNANKKSVTLDLTTPDGLRTFKNLATHADVIIVSPNPGGPHGVDLDYESLRQDNPRLVMASITGFGLSGPYSRFKSPSIVCSAMGGVMYLCGSPGDPPLAEPGDQPYYMASVYAAYGILLALRHRDHTGQGQRVEVSCQEVKASEQHVVVNYSANAAILEREGNRGPLGGGMPEGVYPTKDGYCHIVIIPRGHWRSLLNWMSNPDLLTDPMWENRHLRNANTDVIEPMILDFLQQFPKGQVFAQGQARRIPVAPINRPDEFAGDLYSRERALFKEVQHPVVGSCKLVRPPYRFSESPADIFHPAPILGQHNEEVLDNMKEKHVPAASASPNPSGSPSRPLEGVRVLDFSFAIAGPVLTKILGEHGAEVIKVESEARQQRGRTRPDLDPRIVLQQKATFADVNRNKRSITVNMDTEEGREVIRRLVPQCDVVVENFSPRVMGKWEMDYEKLRELRKDIIMARLPAFGLKGSYRDYLGMASVAMSITGLYHLWSYSEQPEPAGPPVWTADYLSAAYGSVAILASLRHRASTGQGQLIEIGQVDATATLLGTTYLDYFVNGQVPDPVGNSNPAMAPHGVYRCKGADDWCAIAVRDEEEWQSLCKALGRPTWSEEVKFASMEQRIAHRRELDQRIEEWTRRQTPHQVMYTLQKAGVPAGAVQDGEHLFHDSHLRQRGFFAKVDDPETGPIEYPGPIVRLWDTPGRSERCHGPGQDNDYVFGTLLNMSRGEIRRLEEAGVLA